MDFYDSFASAVATQPVIAETTIREAEMTVGAPVVLVSDLLAQMWQVPCLPNHLDNKNWVASFAAVQATSDRTAELVRLSPAVQEQDLCIMDQFEHAIFYSLSYTRVKEMFLSPSQF